MGTVALRQEVKSWPCCYDDVLRDKWLYLCSKVLQSVIVIFMTGTESQINCFKFKQKEMSHISFRRTDKVKPDRKH